MQTVTLHLIFHGQNSGKKTQKLLLCFPSQYCFWISPDLFFQHSFLFSKVVWWLANKGYNNSSYIIKLKDCYSWLQIDCQNSFFHIIYFSWRSTDFIGQSCQLAIVSKISIPNRSEKMSFVVLHPFLFL